jgi:uncharacterized membrane protein
LTFCPAAQQNLHDFRLEEVEAMTSRVALCAGAFVLALGQISLTRADNFSYSTIDFPGASATLVGGINSAGEIVGGYQLPDMSRHGFLDVGGTFTTIDDPNAASGSEATGINNVGQITGAYDLNPPEAGHVLEGAHSFLYNQASMTFSPIDFPDTGITNTTAAKINDSGDVVGVFRLGGPGIGFLLSRGIYTAVNFPGGVGTHANGINNAGNIVGQYKDITSGPHHGFLDNGGTFTTIDFPGATDTFASDINSSGDIVGFYKLGGTVFGFLDKGGSLSTIAFPGSTGTEVYGINDQGDLVGGYADQGGMVHGFEAAPVPEPREFVLLLIAFAPAVAWRRRLLTVTLGLN